MPTLRTLKNRLGTVKNTQQITKAMKMVSASKLRRSQDALYSLRPYAFKIIGIINDLKQRISVMDHPLLVQRPIKKAKVLVVSSDRGLCGSFNANIIKKAETFVKENEGKYEELVMDFAGRKAFEYFKKKYKNIGHSYKTEITPTYANACSIADGLIGSYIKDEFDAMYIIYNEFKSALSQKIVVEQLFPIIPPDFTELHITSDYLYEPNQEDLLELLLPKFVRVEMFRVLLESTASEHGARMTSMENATKNAGEMIKKISLAYNRQRQASITKELMEIVGGKEALEKG
jgi:F-type H+-transporting ATPase subunit gamma